MFKKGDKVYHITLGEGTVSFAGNNTGKCVVVDFPNGEVGDYYLNGKAHSHHVRPSIYHTEPTITVPKRRVEHKGWIGIFEENQKFNYRTCSMIYDTKERAENQVHEIEKSTLQEITYYTEE